MSKEILILRDPKSQAQAKILPWFGFNCYQFSVFHRGQMVELLWSQEGIEEGRARPSGSGIPILFPFPGRISGTTFHWEGKDYSLLEGDGRGNAIHGFVLNRPWRVIESSPSRAVGQFQASMDDPSLANSWPADFRITVSYELQGTSLRSELRVENPGPNVLPCGLGTHPYFRIPLGGANGGDCRVRLPVQTQWELDQMLPTGRVLPLAESPELRSGRRFADMKYDTVMSGLEFQGGKCVTEITDPDGGLRLTQSFDEAFREIVVYTAPHREAICIEPLTCVPGLFLRPDGNEKAGLRLLQPGQSLSAKIEISASSLG